MVTAELQILEPVVQEEEKPKIPRDALGRLLPGATLNPGGRPLLVSQFREFLAAEALPEAKKTLLKCLASEDGQVAMAAVREVYDRLFGKARQEVTGIEGRPIEVATVDVLEVLRRIAASSESEQAGSSHSDLGGEEVRLK